MRQFWGKRLRISENKRCGDGGESSASVKRTAAQFDGASADVVERKHDCWIRRSNDAAIGVVVYVMVGTMACLCYANSLNGQFVHDDIPAIVKNADLRPVTDLKRLLIDDFWGRPLASNLSHKSYRPLTVLTFRINFYFGGLDPLGYHIVNVCLHSVASVLFTIVCRQRFSWTLTLIAGALFAIHPIHTEAVSSVVGRADVLAGVFFLLAFLFYVRAAGIRNTQNSSLCLSLLFGVCSTLSKETGIGVFAVCLLYDVEQLTNAEEQRKSRWLKRVPTFLKYRILALLMVVCIILTLRGYMSDWMLPVFTIDDNPASFHQSFTVRLMTYFHIVVINLWSTLYPVHLSYDWSMDSVGLVEHWQDSRNIFSLLVIAFIVCELSLVLFRKTSTEDKRCRVLGYAFMVFPFLPATNLFYRVGFVVAERLLYIPSMGVVILFTAGLSRVCSCKKRFGVIIIVVLLTSLAARTVVRNKVWHDRNSIFKSGIESTFPNAKQHYNYANLLKDNAHQTKAIFHYQQALRLWPSYVSAINNLATLMTNRSLAEALYRDVINVHPCHANAHYNLANILRSKKRFNEAIESLLLAIHCDRRSALPHSVLASIYRSIHQPQLAEFHYLKTLTLASDRHVLYDNYAVFLFEQGRVIESMHCRIQSAILKHMTSNEKREYSEMVDVCSLSTSNRKPQHHAVNNNSYNQAPQMTADKNDGVDLCICYLDRAQHFEATDDRLKTMQQISDTYGYRGQHSMAIKSLKVAVDSDLFNDNTSIGYIHYLLARHLQDSRRDRDAINHYSIAVQLNPGISDAFHRLAVYLHLQGHYDKAVDYYEAALKFDPGNLLISNNINKMRRQTMQHHSYVEQSPASCSSMQQKLDRNSSTFNNNDNSQINNSQQVTDEITETPIKNTSTAVHKKNNCSQLRLSEQPINIGSLHLLHEFK